jgi:hypothetical protein
MMTGKQALELIGKQAWLKMDEFEIAVTITDAKSAYGKVRVRVKPEDERSKGEAWVDVSRVVVG